MTEPLERRAVAELMSRDLLTIAEDESVLMAWELMCKAEVHHLPVADVQGGFLGVVDAQTLTAAWNATTPRDARRPVTTLLPHRHPAAVRPRATVAEAARAMLEAGTDYTPVTDEHGALVGLVTARDLIAALAGTHREIAPRSAGMPSLYRVEPVLPQPPGHPDRSRIGPD
ncbi:CBS domain-containing protein [Actinomadura chibensis]|uniref:CBS domain-containing protein n=1 Tax=Actinomadura chibensis TaxID=392828 RepID=A0A5D0NHN5_9ACTN|nr:CBS domain-containing protein [Actinomadura chibensis]TYB43937.1 CBS domain-containing protein [Actinomadura chibensis]